MLCQMFLPRNEFVFLDSSLLMEYFIGAAPLKKELGEQFYEWEKKGNPGDEF